MNVKPIANPGAVQEFNQAKSTEGTRYQNAVKAASGQTHTPSQPAPQVVQNQNSISPEEMGAIKAPTTTEDSGQEVLSEETIEQVAAPVEPAKPVDTPESRRFAQLARQEKALRAEAQRIKQQEQSIRQREEAIKAKESSFNQQPQVDMTKYIPRDMLKQDALSVLAEAGVSYEELTQQLINQTPRDPRTEQAMAELRNEIKALKQQNEESQKSQVEQQTQAYQSAVRQIETDVKALVANDPTFETIKYAKAHKDVVELIEQTFHKDGVLLSVEEAAQQVEDYLTEEYTKLANINKIKAKIAASNASRPQTPAVKTPVAQPTQTKQPQPMKTLTNNTSSSRQLSARERALLAFKGELK